MQSDKSLHSLLTREKNEPALDINYQESSRMPFKKLFYSYTCKLYLNLKTSILKLTRH